MTCDLTNPIFTDEAAAVAHMEADRWPNGPVCPLCGVADDATKLGGKTQAGMFQCNSCRSKFTVRSGTVFERSHIPLHKWLLATHLMASSKKGISAHQLHRMLGITYKSAWFMAHRIREAMRPAAGDMLGGAGRIVEADETELTRSSKSKSRPRHHNKKFVSLVERGGRVRSVVTIDGANTQELKSAILRHVKPESTLHTDSAPAYRWSGLPHPFGYMAEHEAVNHSKTYVREGKRGVVHTNTAEGYFSLFKRGLVGTYQHIGEQHLPRYLAEFDFRQNNRARLGVGDAARAARILKGAEGKRLTYRPAD